MISIITSSYKETNFELFNQNIQETIGKIEYEIIQIKNPGIMGICLAYNKGAELAKFDNLLFVHEDVQFLINDWGLVLNEAFKLQNLGILGLAGGSKKCQLPTGHDLGIVNYRNVFVAHSFQEKVKHDDFFEPIKTKTLDGVFLAMNKRTWEELKFDETIDGFHFYDLDISLRSSRTNQNYVIPNIPLLHFSMGNFGDSWIIACLNFHTRNYDYDYLTFSEKSMVRQFWYRRLLSEKIKFKNRLKYFFRMGADSFSRKDALKFLFFKIL